MARLPPDGDPHVFDTRPQCDHDGHRGRETPLQPARRADADDLTHDEPKIETTRMNQETLQDVRATAQMRTPHATGVVDVRERAFDRLAAAPHQPPSASAPDAATIAIHRRLGLGL